MRRKFDFTAIATIIGVALFGLLFLNVYNGVFDSKLDLNGDNVMYYILGNSISNGVGYSSLHIVGNPDHNHFPPGYPVVISAIISLIDSSINTVKIANGVFFFMSLLLLFSLVLKTTENIIMTFVVLVLTLFNPSLLRYSSIMMSEVPFLLFTITAFVLATEMDLSNKWFKNPRFYITLILISASFHIRTVGVSLLAGFVLYTLFEKKWKYALAYCVGFVVLALPWNLLGPASGRGGYLNQLLRKNPYRPEEGLVGITDLFIRIWENVERYITREIPLGILKYPIFNYKQEITSQEWIIGLIMTSIIVFGLIKLNKYRTLFFGYLMGNFGILLLWPSVWTGPRFIMPLFPLLILFLCNGIYNLLLLIPIQINSVKGLKVWRVVIALIPLMLLYFLQPQYAVAKKRAQAPYHKRFKNYFETAQYVNMYCENDAVVCCRKGQLFYIFSNNKTTNYIYSLNKEEVLDGLFKDSVDYVVVDRLGYSSTGRYLVPVLQKYPAKFKLIRKFGKKPETLLFKFNYHYGYFGEFDDSNNRSGLGSFQWDNGNFFFGAWKDGKRNGAGQLDLFNGNILEGVWKDDVLSGRVNVYNSDCELKGRYIYKNNRPSKKLD